MFAAFLSADDAKRVFEVVEKLLAVGGRGCALTGSLAIDAHLSAAGRPVNRRALNDLDLVVESFAEIPAALADVFLLNHVHPHAPEGKMLLQFIDPERGLRIDLFRAFGATVSRARLDEQTSPLHVVAVEDLVARTTAHVCGRLRRGRQIDLKHVRAFTRLAGLGRSRQLDAAWHDHCQDVPGSLVDARDEAQRLLAEHPERVVSEKYSTVVTECERCQDYGRFRRARPETIVDTLGYC